MKTVNRGIVGLGFMGTTHWGVYKGMKNARIVAVADVDAKKRRGDVSAVVGNIGGGDNSKPLDLAGVRVHERAAALIADPDVDVVDVCVPTPDHADIACAALAAGK
ncbi:MAG: Gfo/Idh/MocA family oxidoreductase, partial [Kiritimatiellae bacterium]|nr:Gfo/Idh/MocA family oxidoreductase [Kiritimatiellia bacterium]